MLEMICPRCGFKTGTDSLSRCPQCGQPLQAPMGQSSRITKVTSDPEAAEQSSATELDVWPNLYEPTPVKLVLGQEASHSVFRPAESHGQPPAILPSPGGFFSPGLRAVSRRNVVMAALAGVVLLVLILGSVLYIVNTYSPGSASRGKTHNNSNGSLGLATASASTATGATGSPTVSPTAGNSATYTTAHAPTPTTPVSPPTVSPTATPENVWGQVSNISLANNTFVVTRSGVSLTIDVTATTQWIPEGPGAATSLATLQAGSDAQVTCTVQSNGSCLASQVSSDN
jgi:hypothetical protein